MKPSGKSSNGNVAKSSSQMIHIGVIFVKCPSRFGRHRTRPGRQKIVLSQNIVFFLVVAASKGRFRKIQLWSDYLLCLQGRRKECEIGPTISEKLRPHNYWSDQNFANIRL